MSKVSDAFAEILQQTNYRDTDAMRQSYDELSETMRKESPVPSDMTAYLKTGFATWLGRSLANMTSEEVVITVMTMPLLAVEISRAVANWMWALESNQPNLTRNKFLQFLDLMVRKAEVYTPLNMIDIICAAFELWKLGERYGKRLAAARHRFYLKMEISPNWTCGCKYGPMKKEYFQNCPGCGDPRTWYIHRELIREGLRAITAKYHEAPRFYGSWFCKCPDWNMYGVSGDKCCNTWNPPFHTYCSWCGSRREDDALVAQDENLPAAAQEQKSSPETLRLKKNFEMYKTDLESRMRKWRNETKEHRDGWIMM